jgi:hypothetical protein
MNTDKWLKIVIRSFIEREHGIILEYYWSMNSYNVPIYLVFPLNKDGEYFTMDVTNAPDMISTDYICTLINPEWMKNWDGEAIANAVMKDIKKRKD